MIGRAALLFAAMALAGCQGSGQTPVSRPQPSPQSCAASGGAIEPAELSGAPACVAHFGDAGKRCTDSAQCQGRCINDPWEDQPADRGSTLFGTCEASRPIFERGAKGTAPKP